MDLIQQLVKKNLLNKKIAGTIKSGSQETGKSIEEVILEKKAVKEDELFKIKSELVKFPLKEELVEKITPEVLSIIPRESVEFYKMVPLFLNKKKGILEVGMVFPEDTQAQEALKFLVRQYKFKPKIFLISLSDFQKYFEKYQAPEKEMESALKSLKEEAVKEEKKDETELDFKRLTEEAPIIKMVAVILRQGVEGRASDIHIEPTKENLKIRYRLDGILYPSLFLPMRVHSAIVARIKILSGLKIDETRIPQDGRFSTKVAEKKIDFRVATFPTSLGEKVALRILNPEEGMKSLPNLGFRGRNLEVVNEVLKEPFGMILATGPTGCGKSTSLYAFLRILNNEGVNIVTLEDPVEYLIEGVNQSQIKPDINYTFATGLRQILRQDPDIIMVGEIRDQETASLAIHAGLTGHLVLSTLHTTSAAGVIPRLLDMGIEPFLIPPTLSIAVSQRLIRVLCENCKEKVRMEGGEKKYILDKIKNIPSQSLKDKNLKNSGFIYKPKGCKKCKFTGYAGRVGVYEIIKMTNSLAQIISKDPSEANIFNEARAQGMITMEEDGILKVLEGITTLEEVMRISEEF